MKVVKLCIGDWENASHDKREMSVCRELGAEVSVIAKGDETHLDGEVDGFYVKRLSTRPLGDKIPIKLNRIASVFSWARSIRKQNDIDVLSCHDIVALFIGYLSNIGKKKKAKLVYDSHEFELGRNTKRTILGKLLIYLMERFLIKKCVFSIMVNDSIADEVQKVYYLKNRPVVAKNVPEYQYVDHKVCQNVREQLDIKFGTKDKTVLITHGCLGQDRGIEELLQVIAKREDLFLFLLGSASTSDIHRIRAMANRLNCGERLCIHRAVPQRDIWKYVGAADISMVMIQPASKSYYYALPNKFFESIQSEAPVIASDLPEMKKIIDQYQFGCYCKSDDIDGIIRCIDKMQDRKQYELYENNVIKAKEELCWEKEKEKLKEAYRKIL